MPDYEAIGRYIAAQDEMQTAYSIKKEKLKILSNAAAKETVDFKELKNLLDAAREADLIAHNARIEANKWASAANKPNINPL